MKKNLIAAAAVAVIILGSSCMPGKRGGKHPDAGMAETVFNVRTSEVEVGRIADYIKLGGDVTTETNVDVYPEVQYGKVTQINIRIGQYVRKGETLVVVDPSRPGTTFAANPVKAPISGYITMLFAQLGAVVNSQVPVVRIGVLDNSRDIYVKTFVPEKYVSVIKPGLPAEVQFSYADEPYEAKVSEISPVIDPMSRTFEIWLRFTNFRSDIRVGSYPDVKLFTNIKQNAVKVPADAVLTRSGKQVVFLAVAVEVEEVQSDEDAETVSEETEAPKPGLVGKWFGNRKSQDDAGEETLAETDSTPVWETMRAVRREVETGIRIDGSYEILSGLEGGERLISAGHTLLVDNALIREVIK